ncbi:unnamed protein product, partial [Urochloa humidicola]
IPGAEPEQPPVTSTNPISMHPGDGDTDSRFIA